MHDCCADCARPCRPVHTLLLNCMFFVRVCGLSILTGQCTQWSIYDEYIHDLERQKFEETMKAKAGKKGQQQVGEHTHTHTHTQRPKARWYPVMQGRADVRSAAQQLQARQSLHSSVTARRQPWHGCSASFRMQPPSMYPNVRVCVCVCVCVCVSPNTGPDVRGPDAHGRQRDRQPHAQRAPCQVSAHPGPHGQSEHVRGDCNGLQVLGGRE